jgi:hypothetical protein
MSLGFYSKVIYYLRARSRVTCNACNTRKCNISCQKESDHVLDHFVRDNFWMKYWISESTGSDGESANLHPVTRLASDLSRARQKVPLYCTKVRMYGTISRRPTTLAPTNEESAWLNEEKNHIGKKMISQLSACEVIRVVSLDTNNQA